MVSYLDELGRLLLERVERISVFVSHGRGALRAVSLSLDVWMLLMKLSACGEA